MKSDAANMRLSAAGVYCRKEVWKTYGYWSMLVGVAFFSIYPLCNWFAAQRSEVYRFYFDAELNIPFVPEFFWIYMSLYLLFLLPPFFLNVLQLEMLGKRIVAGTLISGLLFLLFPSRLGYERMAPEGVYGELFGNLFAVDLPYNMAPSLHIVYSVFIVLAICRASGRKVRMVMATWLGLIALSTLLVHQHHMADIVSAWILTIWITSKLIKGASHV